MNSGNHLNALPPQVINPANMMNGNSGNLQNESKKNGKAAKVTLDKNGKPKRKKASRGIRLSALRPRTLFVVLCPAFASPRRILSLSRMLRFSLFLVLRLILCV